MSEQQWYMTRRGHQIGPVPQSEIEAMIRNGGADGDTYVFTPGMPEWSRLKYVNAFQPLLAGGGAGPIPAPPGKTAHEIAPDRRAAAGRGIRARQPGHREPRRRAVSRW
ncbi:MAG: DUF4339 domain-containing protein [Acidobacteriota bacterium]|nr:DUF4339 domain-containing protein [Acidobacteriota bacterium]